MIIIYIIIAVYVYGLNFSYWQNFSPITAEEDYYGDRSSAILLGLVWPFTLISCLLGSPSLKDLFMRKPKFW